MTNKLQQQLERGLQTREDDVFSLLVQTLRLLGLPDVSIQSIHFTLANRTPACPPGTRAVWVATPQADGSVVYELRCQ